MLTEIYYEVDEFIKCESKTILFLLKHFGFYRKLHTCSLNLSEVMTVLIYYHLSDYRHFKAFYTKGIQGVFKSDFPTAPSYNRFVEMIPRALIPLCAFTAYRCTQAKKTGVLFIDSTALPVCFITRAHCHKVFKGFAAKGKTSTGWFFGLKLHIIVNNTGELVNFLITPGNVADNNTDLLFKMTKNIFGTFYGDAGYLMNSDKRLLLELGRLRVFIVKPRKKAKNKEEPMLYKDALWLKKRPLIESVFDIQKEHLDLSVYRQRSPVNGLVTVYATLAAYTFYPDKPSASIIPIRELNQPKVCEMLAA